ncbi:MAG: hypothetical protein V3R42_04680 [candidate division NC10 bacterium]
MDLRRESTKLLILLLSADCLLIVLHIGHISTGYFADPNYSILRQRGFGEVFQYVKQYWIGLLFLYLAITRRSPLYFSWALLFGYLLIDDSFAVHERLGIKISSYMNFSPALRLRAQDFGELAVYAFFGLFFLALTGITYYFSDSSVRRSCRPLFLLLLALVFFGVGMDLFHIMVRSPVWDHILGTIEDGGEMLVMSVIVWFVFLLPSQETVE